MWLNSYTKKEYFAQLPKEIKDGFSELQIGKHLRKAGIIKACGYSCLSIFQLLFLLVFQYRNWYHVKADYFFPKIAGLKFPRRTFH
jgi:hypothetical protein